MAVVSVLATNQLIRAGYERAVAHAGLELVDDGGAADVTLRSEELPQSSAQIDLVVGEGTAVLTVRSLPNETTWQAALQLLRTLLI